MDTCGSSSGMFSSFQAKTSIYSRTRHIRSSFLEDNKLSLMKMELKLASFPKLIDQIMKMDLGLALFPYQSLTNKILR